MRQTTQPSTAPSRQLSGLPIAPRKMPLIGHSLSLLRQPFAFLKSLSSQGGIVRMNIGRMPIYMLTRPETVHTILIAESRRVRRGGVFFDRVRGDLATESGLGTAEGEFHRNRRRLMQPALHRNYIGNYVGLMREHTQALSDSWTDGQNVDMNHVIADLITKNTTVSMFGMGLDPEMTRTVLRVMPILTDNFMVRMQTPKSLARILPLPAIRRFDQALLELKQVTEEVVTQRRNSSISGDALLDTLLAATDSQTGQRMTLEQVHDEVLSSMFAGIVTTASTMAWLFYELDRCPDVQDRVLDEVRTVLHSSVALDKALGQLEYTRRAVQEILRLHPILMFVRRVTEPFELAGVELPAGTDLGYSPYTLHHDSDIYPDPTRLDPDRWLPEREKSLPAGAFIPFGEGRHRCIGEFFAWAEILVAIVVLLPRWKIRLAPGQVVREVNGVHPRPNALSMIVDTR
jgi:cytochrome P450